MTQVSNSPGFFERLSNWTKNSITLKLFVITLIILLLMIPTAMMESLIYERQNTRDEAIREVSSKWGGVQQIKGLAITIPYKLYTIHDGIPQSQILKILQDSRGYIWIATQDGLAYYDGLSFNNITLRKNLSNNYIHCIAEDQNKQIVINIGRWIAKYNGQDFKIDTLKSLLFDHQFVIDNNNRIWANSNENKICYSDDCVNWNLLKIDDAYKNIDFNSIYFDYQYDRLILNDKQCALGLKGCSHKQPCPVHDSYKFIRNSILSMLQTTTLHKLSADLIEGFTYLKH